MTRKHFEALAAALSDSKPEEPTPASCYMDPPYQYTDSPRWDRYREALAQWRFDVLSIAAVCSAFNPRFDDGRFHTACGYKLHTAEA